jgi:hypothetical protein
MKKNRKMNAANVATVATGIYLMLTNIRIYGVSFTPIMKAKWDAALSGDMLRFVVLATIEFVVPFAIVFAVVKLLQTKAAQKALLGAFYVVASVFAKFANLVEKLDAFCR